MADHHNLKNDNQAVPLLARDSYRHAKRQRAQGAPERPLVLTNIRLLDIRTGTCSTYGHCLVVHKGRIAEIDAQMPAENAIVINCGGMLLMPGGAGASV